MSMQVGPAKSVATVIFLVGLAAFGVLGWILRRLLTGERGFQAGDAVMLGVFAVFGALCCFVAWQLFAVPDPGIPGASDSAPLPRSPRVRLSYAASAIGVLLLVLGLVVPPHWHPVAWFFAGLALLAGAHVLTPCEEQIDKLRKTRSFRQL